MVSRIGFALLSTRCKAVPIRYRVPRTWAHLESTRNALREEITMCHDNKRDESTAPACGHFNLAPYGCEHCFMSHEEIAAERDASKRDEANTGVQNR
jgi:hypothetical protein